MLILRGLLIYDRLQIKSKNLILTIARHEILRFLIEADCLVGLPLLLHILNLILMQLLVRVFLVWLWFAGII